MNIEEPNTQFLDSIPKIRVVIRKRPLGKKEIQKNELDIVDVRGTQTAIVRETKTKVDLTKYIEEHNFNFDRAFDEASTNEQIYLETMRPLVECLFNKAKVTCFAYGQTGSGKTFTMMGDLSNKDNMIPGLYLLAAHDIFTLLEQPSFKNLEVYISFYEIYCSKLHDLLNDRQQLFPREDAKQNVNIVGLSEKRVLNVNSLMQIIDFGNSVRTTASTSANLDSSRSHAILQISLKSGNKLHGKMSFIDLAGSERGADVVDTNKQTRMDGAEINKSLLALKECIRALDQDKKHTPFRGSKLTLVLKDSFTGNCKTLMIGNISPAGNACEHTLNTLRYADRVKELKKPNGENEAPLSQADLLAKQLMLPRQNMNSTKIILKKPEENFSEDADNFLAAINKKKTSINPKHSISGLQALQINQPGEICMLNQQSFQSVPANLNNCSSFQPQGNLFDQSYAQAANKEPRFMKEIMNTTMMTPNQHNNFSKQNNSLHQASLYQNNNIFQQNFSAFQPSFQIENKENIRFENCYSSLSNSDNQNLFPVNNKSDPRSSPYNNFNMAVNEQTHPRELSRVRGHDDLMLLYQRHQQLINLILTEEEELIAMHRHFIDDTVNCTKQQMMLISDVEKPSSSIDDYIYNLDAILSHKSDMINLIRNKMHQLKEYLREEEMLSQKFNEQKQEMMDIFDLNTNEQFKNDECQLLDDLHQVMS